MSLNNASPSDQNNPATSGDQPAQAHDLSGAIQALTTVLAAKDPGTQHFAVETLSQLGTLLTASTFIGLIGKMCGTTDEQTAGISIFVILTLYTTIYRDVIQKVVKVYVIIIAFLVGMFTIFLLRDQLRSAIVGQTLSKTTGIIEYTPKANDFLPKLATYIDDAKQEIWLTGISFYVTLPQHKERFIKKLEAGTDVRFLVYDPRSSNIRDVASGYSQTEASFRSECDVTLSNLHEIYEEWHRRSLPGHLEIRLFSSIPKSRIYVFDRKLETGVTYFIPLVDNQNSPNLPGFLVRNIKTGIAPAYFEGIERLWNTSKPYETWLAEK